MWDDVLGAQKGALEVHVHDSVPGSPGDSGHAAVLYRHDASIVIEYIHLSKRGDGRVDHVPDIVLVGGIGLDKDGATARVPNASGSLLALGGSDVGDDNARAFTREQFGRGFAHTTC